MKRITQSVEMLKCPSDLVVIAVC
uniref:Uncharacterized protein n=1 Tax=Anguilla anguilla TaxID=7936 RepID=A0A0E9VL70_ANGAN